MSLLQRKLANRPETEVQLTVYWAACKVRALNGEYPKLVGLFKKKASGVQWVFILVLVQ